MSKKNYDPVCRLQRTNSIVYYVFFVVFFLSPFFGIAQASNFSNNRYCNLEVDAGQDISICNPDGVTLTANVSGLSDCVTCIGGFNLENTNSCNGNPNFVLQLDGTRYFSSVNLVWRENADGTATLKGTIFDFSQTQSNYILDVTFSSKKDYASGGPEDHLCNNEDTSNWVFYKKYHGTLTSEDGLTSLEIRYRSSGLQVGSGANIEESALGVQGAFGEFYLGSGSNRSRGSFNFNIGNCTTYDTNQFSYLWSTGATTPTIVVSDPGMYTVTVTDCEDCEATDTIEVKPVSFSVDAGDDMTICSGDEITLSAEILGDTQCGDCDQFSIKNATNCETNLVYVLELYDKRNGITRRFANVNLQWQEFQDGTASLKGEVVDINNANEILELDIAYSDYGSYGKETDHLCYYENDENWMFYNDYSGTIKNTDGSWSSSIYNKNYPLQIGNGANIIEKEEGRYGAYGKFKFEDGLFYRGEFTFNLGDCLFDPNQDIQYLWSNGATTPEITVTPNASTSYTVTVTSCNDCVASDSVQVDVENPITVDLGTNQQICLGDNVMLTAQVTDDGSCEKCISYDVENTNYCLGNEQFVIWMEEEGTNFRRWFSNKDLIWLENGDGTASLKGMVTQYSVGNEEFVVDLLYTGKTAIPPVNSPKSHSCNQEDSTDWIYYTGVEGTIRNADNSIVLNVSRRGPSFQVGNGANMFEAEMSRNAGGGWINVEGSFAGIGDVNINFGNCLSTQTEEVEYLWSTGETSQSITVSPSENTTYSVTVAGCGDCGIATDQIEVVVDNVNADAGDDVTITPGETVTLTAQGGDSYQWSIGDNTQSIQVSPNETTTYEVTVIKGGCEAMDQVTVFVEGCNAQVTIEGSEVACFGERITLTANGTGSFVWSTGETTPSIEVTPTEMTTYSVTSTVSEGCEATDQITVEAVNFTVSAGFDQVIPCDDTDPKSQSLNSRNQVVILSASLGEAYLWTIVGTGEVVGNTQSIFVTPTQTTDYEVQVSFRGCVASDVVRVVVEECPTSLTPLSSIDVYPNVVQPSGRISMDYFVNENTVAEFILRDISGMKLTKPLYKKLQKGGKTISLDLNQFNISKEGIYLLEINSNGISKIEKIVIKQ